MNILLVDDEYKSRSCLAEVLKKLGHNVVEKSNGEEALDAFTQQQFHLVLTDNRMPRMSGIDLLENIRALPTGADVDMVIITGFSDLNTAIRAIRLGAFDYLLKPLSMDDLLKTVGRVAEHQANKHNQSMNNMELQESPTVLGEENDSPAAETPLDGICISSPVIKKIFELGDKLHTDRSVPILIEGETGTGKELIARYIHYGPEKVAAPFIALNCAALTPSIFESELFGYEPGTFTGGLPRGKKGKIDMAKGGTLFLDEISEIPISLQVKLLRVLQEKEFYRVGGLNLEKTDLRVICATNQNIAKMVAKGTFRQDLYYRLNVAHIFIPPLRERPEDILPLAEMYLQQFARKKNKNFKTISPQAAKILLSYRWPGNVRELRNIMEWVTFMGNDEELRPSHLSVLQEDRTQTRQEEGTGDRNYKTFSLPSEGLPLNDFSNNIILKALKMHNGNKSETAKYLNISRSSLYYRLKNIKTMN
ncbi:MAG: sigma-54-dependent transcriptional regulator [Syntrophomonadaceae bacterium]|jgi:two-component system response regulator AtoC